MADLSLLADEHVKRAFVTALRSNGFQVETVTEAYEPGTDDRDLLEYAEQTGLILLTSDSDFASLGGTTDHAGIIEYHQYGHEAQDFVSAIVRMDRHLDHETFENHVEWLENWL